MAKKLQTYQSNQNLSINIDNQHIAVIEPVNNEWIGSETVLFIVTDPNGATGQDSAIFTIYSEETTTYNLQRLSINDQTIIQGQQFNPINLDDHIDCDPQLKPQLTWTYQSSPNFVVQISEQRIAQIYSITILYVVIIY